jgi:hypothetical protein
LFPFPSAVLTTGIDEISNPKNDSKRIVITFFDSTTKPPIFIEIEDEKRRDAVLQRMLMELRDTRNKKLSYITFKEGGSQRRLLGSSSSSTSSSPSSSPALIASSGTELDSRARLVESRPREPTLEDERDRYRARVVEREGPRSNSERQPLLRAREATVAQQEQDCCCCVS